MGDEKRRTQIPNLADQDEGDGEETKIGVKASQAPASRGRNRPFLIVLTGGSVGEMFAVKQPEIIVGRARNATIHIDDEGISRKHAKLTCEGTTVHIEDLGSANGTSVNDQKLTFRQLLGDGDKVTLGSTTILKFTYSDDVDETFQRRMFEAALRDGLTKAYNKKYLLERLDKELAYAQRHKTPLSLIMLDIDHFKKVNDTFGHPAGDAVLIMLSRVALDTLRKEDVFARYGGEEFAVVCRGVDVKGATILAERLRDLFAAMRASHDGHDLSITASFGVAGYPEVAAETPAQLIAAADEALYEAKRAGRNRVVSKS